MSYPTILPLIWVSHMVLDHTYKTKQYGLQVCNHSFLHIYSRHDIGVWLSMYDISSLLSTSKLYQELILYCIELFLAHRLPFIDSYPFSELLALSTLYSCPCMINTIFACLALGNKSFITQCLIVSKQAFYNVLLVLLLVRPHVACPVAYSSPASCF